LKRGSLDSEVESINNTMVQLIMVTPVTVAIMDQEE